MQTVSQIDIDNVFDKATYLHLISSFAPSVDYRQIKELVTSTYGFFKNSNKNEIEERFEEINQMITNKATHFQSVFPLKKEISEISREFNELCKSDKEIYSNGLDYGWVSERIDISNLNFFTDTPYHFKLGIGSHKGNGAIEEDFLLNDSFNILVKAKYYHELLLTYGNKVKTQEELKGEIQFSENQYKQITDIKIEVAALSRFTIISFFAFLEGFVNSVGHSHLLYKRNSLNQQEKELLSGVKKGRYLNLRSKIEIFQSLIREDKKVKFKISDSNQISNELKIFFDYYEQLRNSAMHFSPIKERIWLRPLEWLERAEELSKLALEVSIEFWRFCYPYSNGPEYLDELDYELHIYKALKRLDNIRSIELKITKPNQIL